MDDDERAERLAVFARFRDMGEKAYDDMYEVYTQREINTCYRDAKDYFVEAIRVADELGLGEEAERLRKRLLHIMGVYRSQFAG